VVFRALSEPELIQIIDLQLDRVRTRLVDRRISLDVSDSAKRHLVKVGYDPIYGARPLKRAVQRELETQLGRKILGGEVKDGDRVFVDYDERSGTLTFTTGLPQFPVLAN
jgi:ATP-dependent Clp protease ATP-binding subunit ClpB